MIRRSLFIWVFLALGCASSDTNTETTSPSENGRIMLLGGKADAWDRLNDPERFAKFLDEDLVYRLADLPREGRATKEPWPGDLLAHVPRQYKCTLGRSRHLIAA